MPRMRFPVADRRTGGWKGAPGLWWHVETEVEQGAKKIWGRYGPCGHVTHVPLRCVWPRPAMDSEGVAHASRPPPPPGASSLRPLFEPGLGGGEEDGKSRAAAPTMSPLGAARTPAREGGGALAMAGRGREASGRHAGRLGRLGRRDTPEVPSGTPRRRTSRCELHPPPHVWRRPLDI